MPVSFIRDLFGTQNAAAPAAAPAPAAPAAAPIVKPNSTPKAAVVDAFDSTPRAAAPAAPQKPAAPEPLAATALAPRFDIGKEVAGMKRAREAMNTIVDQQINNDGFSAMVPIHGEKFEHVQYDYRHLTPDEIAEYKKEDPDFKYDASRPINQPQEAHFKGLKDGHLLDVTLVGSVSAHNMDPFDRETGKKADYSKAEHWRDFLTSYQRRTNETTFALEVSYSDGSPAVLVKGLKPARPEYAAKLPYDKQLQKEFKEQFGAEEAKGLETVKNTVVAANATIPLRHGVTVTIKLWPEQSLGAEIYASQRMWKLLSEP